LLAPALLLLVIAYRNEKPDLPDWKVWPLFAGAAVAMIPTGMLGRMKYGGDLNNYGMADLFLSLALAVALLRCSTYPAARQVPIRLGLMLVIGVQAISSPQEIYRLPTVWRQLADSSAAQAYRAAQAYPGKIYFPWHPLAALLTDNRLDHAGFCLFDRDLAGIEVTETHFRQYLPPKLEYVAFLEGTQEADRNLMARLPEFTCRTELPELPEWTIYTRCTSAADRGNEP
jgi:hypothetical protein